eukprot:NODE_30262_length_423_cov_1.817568.p2 GENE.NODE_30262_length_423_cov_1.817568~~NODE_30262_length_423_cov_1.817568.p2  ORF type:complete len:102 (+),score=46.75 NODE_30262_length_423_cov_1.817568:104-409(+)
MRSQPRWRHRILWSLAIFWKVRPLRRSASVDWRGRALVDADRWVRPPPHRGNSCKFWLQTSGCDAKKKKKKKKKKKTWEKNKLKKKKKQPKKKKKKRTKNK